MLPKITDDEDLCLANFELRKLSRFHYPGACLLKYQSHKLFQWGMKEQKAKGPGVLGTLIVFAPADEEQGRETINMYMQGWIKEVNPKTRDDLLHNDSNICQKSRSQLYSYVDKVMCTRYGEDLGITHRCKGLPNTVNRLVSSCDEGYFQQLSHQVLRDARSKGLLKQLGGHILQ